jgi:hypothetical protein
MSAVTVTFGDCAENGPGMQQLRARGAEAVEGFSYEELLRAKRCFEQAGCPCELVDLVAAGGVEHLGGEEGPEPAYVLLARGGVAALAGAPAAAVLAEQRALPADTKALFRGEVKNKLARHNLCFADAPQEPDYEAGRGRVVPFASVPLTAAVREALPRFFGPKAVGLYAEGNYYYRPAVCGIGFHGDGERACVIALRLGPPFPLHFQWFLRSRPEGRRVALAPADGDVYAMSAKAVGRDWRRPTIPTLRHAAGAAKYLQIPA